VIESRLVAEGVTEDLFEGAVSARSSVPPPPELANAWDVQEAQPEARKEDFALVPVMARAPHLSSMAMELWERDLLRWGVIRLRHLGINFDPGYAVLPPSLYVSWSQELRDLVMSDGQRPCRYGVEGGRAHPEAAGHSGSARPSRARG
jgi:hypothetical protein